MKRLLSLFQNCYLLYLLKVQDRGQKCAAVRCWCRIYVFATQSMWAQIINCLYLVKASCFFNPTWTRWREKLLILVSAVGAESLIGSYISAGAKSHNYSSCRHTRQREIQSNDTIISVWGLCFQSVTIYFRIMSSCLGVLFPNNKVR